ncbi:50S ribosomal protein L10 [bacterium]|nr:50S ribosomal protein L10 [bacterium]
MAKQLKQLIRKEIEKRFRAVDGGIVVGYRGLDSEKIYDLRAKLRAKGARLHVVKNAMAIRAFQTLGYEESKLLQLFDGPVGVVYSQNGAGAVGAAKALRDWKAQTRDKFVEVKGGFLEGSIIDKAGVKALADMPSREQLLGMVAGAFQAPIAAFANRLNECVAKFAYAVNAVKEKKEKEGGGASPQPAK